MARGFHLEPAADHRLDEIFEYTQHQWDATQAERYVRGLFACFEGIARREIVWKPIPADFGVSGYLCRHEQHFIYWKERADGNIAIVSILHVRMHQRRNLASDLKS
jgi:toxin ParE1/3/4